MRYSSFLGNWCRNPGYGPIMCHQNRLNFHSRTNGAQVIKREATNVFVTAFSRSRRGNSRFRNKLYDRFDIKRMTFVCFSTALIINTYIRFVDFGWLITLFLYHRFWYNCKKCILLYIKPSSLPHILTGSHHILLSILQHGSEFNIKNNCFFYKKIKLCQIVSWIIY